STPYKIGSAYNAMIYPVRKIPVAGAIWYQGESNQNYPYYYPELLATLVDNWRTLWGGSASDFPFYIAQICPFQRLHNFPTYYSNPKMRFMQANASLSIENSGIESNDDIGNLQDIHPKNKQDVGLRLAYLALHNTYAKADYKDMRSPLFSHQEISGNSVTIHFHYA